MVGRSRGISGIRGENRDTRITRPLPYWDARKEAISVVLSPNVRLINLIIWRKLLFLKVLNIGSTAVAYLTSVLRYLDLFDIYVNNTLHNDFLGNREYHWGCRTKSLKTVHVCMYPLALNQQTFERFNGIISRTYLIFLISHYAVWRMRWSYLHIKQIQISQDWSEIRESCKDQSL